MGGMSVEWINIIMVVGECQSSVSQFDDTVYLALLLTRESTWAVKLDIILCTIRGYNLNKDATGQTCLDASVQEGKQVM